MSSLCNKICAFLCQNNFIESHIQTGFVHNMSGTFEHTAHLAYVINNARVKQRSLDVTLLDLKTRLVRLIIICWTVFSNTIIYLLK